MKQTLKTAQSKVALLLDCADKPVDVYELMAQYGATCLVIQQIEGLIGDFLRASGELAKESAIKQFMKQPLRLKFQRFRKAMGVDETVPESWTALLKLRNRLAHDYFKEALEDARHHKKYIKRVNELITLRVEQIEPVCREIRQLVARSAHFDALPLNTESVTYLLCPELLKIAPEAKAPFLELRYDTLADFLALFALCAFNMQKIEAGLDYILSKQVKLGLPRADDGNTMGAYILAFETVAQCVNDQNSPGKTITRLRNLLTHFYMITDSHNLADEEGREAQCAMLILANNEPIKTFANELFRACRAISQPTARDMSEAQIETYNKHSETKFKRHMSGLRYELILQTSIHTDARAMLEALESAG